MNALQDLTTFSTIGLPVVIRTKTGVVYGRVVSLHGTPVGRVYSQVTFRTPGGSTIGPVGIMRFSMMGATDRLTTEDLEKLRTFEELAKKKGQVSPGYWEAKRQYEDK